LADSARQVAQRSRGTPDVDPTRDLVYMDAFVHTLLEDRGEAIRLLKVYLAANPDQRKGMADDTGWWWRSLQDDPAYQQVVKEQ
jgi:hypothetical protein